ncbi:MAG: beta-glucosidase [Gammaproteobacteria bacterium]
MGIDPLPQVIAALTPEEKIDLVVGVGMSLAGLPLPPEMQGPADGPMGPRVPGAGGMTRAVPRLGIPSIVLADGPAGLRISPRREGETRSFHATAFPVATLLASSWDTALIERVGAAMGAEARDYGIDVLLAPALNIHRNPLGGRGFEYYSEDPVISGRMAAAAIRGIQSTGVIATPKHLVANEHEWNRYTIDVQVAERPLREIYLRAFEIAVREGRPQALMTSYNRLNGTYTSQNRQLIDGVLRREWGYFGVVMTDWYAGDDPVAQLRAGNDLLMPGTGVQQRVLREALARGTLKSAELDRHVAQILMLVLRSPTFLGVRATDVPDLEGHAKLAREAAASGMVLLRNVGGVLPLPRSRRIALFGNASYDAIIGGSGSGAVAAARAVPLAEGLRASGYAVDAAVAEGYVSFIDETRRKTPPRSPLSPSQRFPERSVSEAEIESAAQRADVAVVTIGRRSGEFADLSRELDFELQAGERELLERLSRAFRARGKNVVVVLNIGSVMETVSWRGFADAILLAWQPGQEGGHAMADVLSGTVAPSGRLATTFPLRWEDVPSSKGFPGTTLLGPDPAARGILAGVDRRAEVRYDEGLAVGYRHDAPVAYPFGFGLSYTQFRHSRLRVDPTADDGGVRVSATVTNTGRSPGREVVQVYVSPPSGADAGVRRPGRELRAFTKTPTLAPGQSMAIELQLSLRDFALFDETQRAWVVPAGTYTVSLGSAVTDIRATARAEFPQALTVAKVSERL